MATRSTTAVSIKSRNRPELPLTTGRITRVEWDKVDRTKNATKTFWIFIALMAGAALVPFWHFFLVPTFFITAFVMAMEKLKETTRNEGGEGICPQCGETLSIVKSKWSPRITDTCGKCFNDVEINLQSEG